MNKPVDLQENLHRGPLRRRIYQRLSDLTPEDQDHPDLSLTDNFLWAIWEELQHISELLTPTYKVEVIDDEEQITQISPDPSGHAPNTEQPD